MDDYVLNVRQIAQYPTATPAPAPTDLVLLQPRLGAPYEQATVWDLVQGAMAIPLPPDNAGTGLVAPSLGTPLYGPQGFNFYVNQQGGNSLLRNGAAGVWNFDGTTLSFAMSLPGLHAQPIAAWTTVLNIKKDILEVPGSIYVGRPPCEGMEVANAGYVDDAINQLAAALQAQFAIQVTSFNGRIGDIFLDLPDILRAGGAPQVSPHFAGYPTAPTPWDLDQSDSVIATTAFVQNVFYNFVQKNALVLSWNGRGGAVVMTDADITAACTTAGARPQSVTPATTDNSNAIATTAFVTTAVATLGSALETTLEDYITTTEAALYAPLASPQFTGIPDAPTAAPGTSTGQLATTAFVHAAVVAATTGVASFNTRTGAIVLQGADISAAGGALLTNPAFLGTPTAPTATVGTNTGQLATTAFVHNAVGVSAGVTSFNTRLGAVTLTLADVTATNVLADTALTGIPTAPTAAPATATTQLATTAFVQAAVAGSVNSFNGRVGAVTLQAADISAVGGALLVSPAFSGTPTAPTANAGTNTTQLATTQFVMTQLAAGGVTTFNGRGGAVTLTATDITGAGGALLASPALTGIPTAPTAAAATSTLQLATTAFVTAAIAGLATTAALANYLPLTGGTLTGGLIVNNNIASIATSTTGALFFGTGSGRFFLFDGTTFQLNGGPLNIANNGLTVGGAIYSQQAGGQGQYFFGTSGTRYLWFDGTTFQLNGASLSIGNGGLTVGGAIYSQQAANQGQYFFGTGGSRYIWFDGTNFNFVGGSVVVAGNITSNFNVTSKTLTVTNNAGAIASFVLTTNSDFLQAFYSNTSTLAGSIIVSGAAASFNTSSDERLKTDLKAFDAGTMIDQTLVYDFKWKSSGERAYGIVAQQAQDVYPHAIVYKKDEDWYGVDYSKYVPLLLQEAKSLRSRAAKAETLLQKLLDRIAKLEAA